jgi:plastocyanin
MNLKEGDMSFRVMVLVGGSFLALTSFWDESRALPIRETSALPQQNAEILVRDFEFSPPVVEIPVGGSVTWKFEGPTAHSSTADPGSQEHWDSGIKGSGESWSRKFEKAGTFSYHCTPHPFIKARVVVK